MKPTPRDGILRGGVATLIRLLLLAAFGISGYLLSVSLSGGQVAGCGPGSACDAVLQSRWAYVFGIPVSALALVVDLALLVTTFSCGARSMPKQRRGAWEILAPFAVLLLGSAIWFTALQAIVLRRFCPWCLAAHACGAIAATLLLMRVPVTDSPRERDAAVPRAKLIKFSAIALTLVALLGAAQTLAPGKTYSLATVASGTSNASVRLATSNSPTAANSTGNTNLVTPAQGTPLPALEIYGGRVRLDLERAPIWGPINAPHKLISLFDYTCSHCREMHERVVAVQREFGDKLAVVSLPMPLDSMCNPLMIRAYAAHTNACLYAKIGLAVWRAHRPALLPFDDWFFSFPDPPPLTDVTNKAVELVGAANFSRAIHDPWIDAQIKTSIEIFAINMREQRQDRMPQFMIGTNLMTGTPPRAELRAMVGKYIEGAGR